MVLIYRIDGGGLTYVGSTIKKLHQRLSEHESKYKIWKEGKTHYVTSFKVLQHDHEITLIEECTDEARKEREAHWIRTLTCVNKKIEGRTDYEYRQDNKDKIQQYHKDNKDRINEWSKQYRKDNKDRLNECNKQYRKDNEHKLNEKFECPCGGRYTHKNKSKHFKTKLHQNYLNQA